MAISGREKEKRKSKVSEIRVQFNFLRDGALEEINAPPPAGNVKEILKIRG